MHTSLNSRGLLVGLVVLTTVGVSACSANPAPGNAGTADGQTIPAATAAVKPPAATTAASPPAGTPSATPTSPEGVRDLVITSAEKSELTATYVAFRRISPSDVSGGGPVPGSVYFAYIPATYSYWALARFEPSSTASLNAQVGFQDGGNIGMFWKAGAGSWHIASGGIPTVCGELAWFPPVVLTAWALPTSPPTGMSC